MFVKPEVTERNITVSKHTMCKIKTYIKRPSRFLRRPVNNHQAFESILVDWQHSLRSQRSCETQLVQFYHDSVSSLNGAINCGHKQIVIIILDFDKAFNKVPHRRLLHKLDYYGTRVHTGGLAHGSLGAENKLYLMDTRPI